VEVGAGSFEQRKVKLGRRGDDFYEVLDGVRAGELVVTVGNLLIDAQAQLDATTRSMGGQAPKVLEQPMSATNAAAILDLVPAKLAEGQAQSAGEFLKLTSGLGAALAADDLNKFNELAPRIHALIPRLLDSLGNIKALRPGLQKLEESGHLENAKDLAAARKEFLPFSTAAVEMGKQLRAVDEFKGTKIFNCPMVNRAIPGAPKNGQWIQLEAPLRNPFFGAAMLECGSEVK
jgi:Cu(I)/Ag(I) efflux system membrane fusion protein